MVYRDCLGRTPFGSLIACLLCLVGVGIFCVGLYKAVYITAREIFENLFLLSIPWLETIQVVFIVIAVVMGLFSILLLTFGFLATGATRQNIYSGAKCIMGGRVSAGFFLGVSYILNLVWVVVTSTCALPLIIYAMLYSICDYEVEGRQEWYFEEYCFNLSRFGIYVNWTEGVHKNALCEDWEMGEFCQQVKNAGPLYSMAFIGSLLIVMAMVMFMTTLSTNYTRVKTVKEVSEYKQAIALGELTAEF